MSDVESLRRAFDERLAPVEEHDDHSRECPACEKDGIPTPSKYREELLECPTTGCGVYHFLTGNNKAIPQPDEDEDLPTFGEYLDDTEDDDAE